MIQVTFQLKFRKPLPRRWLPLLWVCAFSVWMSGCLAHRTRPSIAWGAAAQARPTVPVRGAASTDQIEDPAPDLRMETPPLLSPLATARAAPARPRVPAASSAQTEPAGKSDAPQIVPELSAQESAVLQQQTEQSLAAAERNISSTSGKTLNAAQMDVASKVGSFISQAREAGRTGDWARARSLANKAQVLSEELARSL